MWQTKPKIKWKGDTIWSYNNNNIIATGRMFCVSYTLKQIGGGKMTPQWSLFLRMATFHVIELCLFPKRRHFPLEGWKRFLFWKKRELFWFHWELFWLLRGTIFIKRFLKRIKIVPLFKTASFFIWKDHFLNFYVAETAPFHWCKYLFMCNQVHIRSIFYTGKGLI